MKRSARAPKSFGGEEEEYMNQDLQKICHSLIRSDTKILPATEKHEPSYSKLFGKSWQHRSLKFFHNSI